jgi:hypothetical protein
VWLKGSLARRICGDERSGMFRAPGPAVPFFETDTVTCGQPYALIPRADFSRRATRALALLESQASGLTSHPPSMPLDGARSRSSTQTARTSLHTRESR